MPMADIKVGDLASRAIRQKISPGNIKRIAINQYETKKNEQGGIIGWFVNAAVKFVGFALGVIFGFLSWSITTLVQWLVAAVSFIWNFNWNASDSELDNQLNAAVNAFGGVLGGALGNALGYIVTGTVAGVVLFQFNEPLAVHVLNDLGEEALEEITANAANVIRAGGRILMRYFFNWSYKKLRQMIVGSYSPKEALAFQQDKNRKPWSFAQKFEEKIESIPNEFWRNFAEEFFEEFFEATAESLYIIAGSMDSYYTQQKMETNATLKASNAPHTVQVQLNRSPNTQTPPTKESAG
jgi:lipoprotein signal peptidase